MAYAGSLFYPRWEKGGGEAQLSWDASGYYWYLPSVFIYHDLKAQTFKDSILQKYHPVPPEDFQQGFKLPSGDYVMKYTAGMAIMELPFFAIAHVSAQRLGYDADGFSRPYQFMIYAGAMLFVFIGLWYLRRLLLLYYSDLVTAIVLLLLVLGTSYLNYASIDVGMTHCWLFSLYVFILWNTHFYYRSFQRKYALRLGALIGLITLVRPTEAIAVLIPLLWGLEAVSRTALKERIRLFKTHIRTLLAASFIGLCIVSLQFIYWKYASGHWFVYSYGDQGFSWLSPHFRQYTLNFQCGWLVYTPVMFFALIGIIPFVKRGKNKLAILALIAVNYYIVCAWNAWDYGGRAMIQSYPVLMFPLASFMQSVLSRKLLTWIVAPVALLFIYFNLWWTYQAHKGSLAGNIPGTSAYFWATVLRYDLPPEIQKLKDNKDLFRGTVTNAVVLYQNALTDTLTVTKEVQQSFVFPAPAQKFKWIRAEAAFFTPAKESNLWFMTHFRIRLKKAGQQLEERSIRVQRFLEQGVWQTINVDIHVDNQDFDQVEILFSNENNGPTTCVINNLKVIGFNE